MPLPQEVMTRPHVVAKLVELNGRFLPPNPDIIDRCRMAALLDG
jgi:hypothetical protein